MLGPFGNFFASFYSAELYHWAAHTRRGIGLSYIFGISILIVLFTTIYCTYSYGSDWMTLLLVENKVLPFDLRMIFSVIIPNEVLVYIVAPVLSCLAVTLLLFNLAIASSVTIGQILNYLYDAPLEFTEVLRANCYIIVAALSLTALMLFFLPTLLYYSPMVFLGLVIFYNFYGIIFPKFDI